MDLKEIQKLVKLAKKSGLIHIKVGDIELEFTKEAVGQRPKKIQQEEIKEKKEDELKTLFWSVPNLDPLAEAQ